MFLFQSKSHDPRFNLALEEHLFEHFTDEFLILYRNDSSVIIGKHQNAVAECNIPFLTKENIPFIRRFSGGGTVYHDLNNINFSFISQGLDTKVIDFKKYANPVIDFLISKGLNATLSERNDILLGGKKISGHAAHAKNKRALHHGTLLFNADLNNLSKSLKSNKDKFISRAVKSVRSEVCNIYNLLPETMEVEPFMKDLSQHLSKHFQVEKEFHLQPKDLESIEKLIKTKYNTWEWNVSYSPEYSFEVNGLINDQAIKAKFEVQKGIFTKVTFDNMNEMDSGFKTLIGKRHDFNELEILLSSIWGNKSKELLNLLF